MQISDLKTVGYGLARPEGVMALNDGTILAADARGCCARIEPDGKTSLYGDVDGIPNGICLDKTGNCIIANIGNGQVQELAPDGTHRVLATEAQGRRINTPNFPFLDRKGRLWVSDSTAGELEEALREPAPDGAVVVIEGSEARIAAEELFFANGIAVDAAEEYLYVAESTRRAVTRFAITGDGRLADREIYGPEPLAELGFPDGIALDEAGNLWVTFPVWGAVGFIDQHRELHIVVEDSRMSVLKRPANICFGGAERRTAYIGSLEGRTIPCFRVPHPGQPLVHQL
jgi:sugar lactone lactonase YvrE